MAAGYQEGVQTLESCVAPDLDGECLSYVGEAARQALKTNHMDSYRTCWNVTHGQIADTDGFAVKQTPPSKYWSQEEITPHESHSDDFLDCMQKVIVKAEEWLDICSLSPPDGRFEDTFKKAIDTLAKNATESGKKVTVRLLFGNIIGMPVNCHQLMDLLRPQEGSNVEMWIGAWRKGTSWNHAKIIAADGKHLFTGGHNIWDGHYLRVNPVHDISIELQGQVAHDGHVFANKMWEYIIQTDKSDFVLNWTPGWIPNKNRVGVSHFPSDAGKYPPMYEPSSQPLPLPEAMKQGDLPIITIGRYGSLHADNNTANPSDSAIVAMLGCARKVIRMSIQDLGPLLLPVPGDIKVPIPGGVWPEEYMSAIALAMYEREVDVDIVLSHPYACPGRLSPLTANYGNGWLCTDVAAEIIKALLKKKPELKNDSKLRKLVQDHLKVTFIRSCKDCNFWPDGSELGNHAKFFVVDDLSFYIGSQNLYIANLAEWGVVVDNEVKVQQVLAEYWHPMWAQSYTPKDCDIKEVMDSLQIDRSGCDAEGASDEMKALALQARRRQAYGSCTNYDLDEVCLAHGVGDDTASAWCNDVMQWVAVKRGDPIPPEAIQSGSTPTDGICYVGRFDGFAGKLNADDGKMWNFWYHHTTALFFRAGAKQEAEILLGLKSAVVEWKPIQRGTVIPENAVQAGVTKRDGFVYVGRHNGEAGKINKSEGKMWNFWGHRDGEQHEAEILLITRSPDSPLLKKKVRPEAEHREPLYWIPIERGDPIPPTAVKAGMTSGDGVTHVGRFNGEAGKINELDGNMVNFWGLTSSCQQKADILVVPDQSLLKWVALSKGSPIPDNAVTCGMTREDGRIFVGRRGGECGKILRDDNRLMKEFGCQASGRFDEAEILLIDPA